MPQPNSPTPGPNLFGLADRLPDGVVTTDTEGKIVYCNPAFEQFLGLKSEDVIGKPLAEVLALSKFANIDYLRGLLKEILAGKSLSSIKIESQDKDGKPRHSEIRILPAKKDGAIVGAQVIMTDATERKRAEKALWESEKKFRELVENLNDVTYSVDVNGKIEYISPSIAHITGYTPEEITGRNLFDFFSPVDKNQYGEQMQRTADAGSSIGEYLIAAKDKSPRWIRASSKCVMKNGNVVCVNGIMTDITERKRAEEALRESEERYRNLFENSRDALMTIGPPSWNFNSGNPATLAMFGAKNQEAFESCAPWELSPELQPDGRPSAEKAKEMIETAVREGSHFFEWNHKRINGEEFPATVLLTRMEVNGETVVQATVRDITGQKRMEEEKGLLQKQLFQAQKMKAIGTLAGGIAHDFNNTLAVIVGSASFGLDQTKPSDPNNELFREIQHAANHATTLTRKLLAFSRQQLLREEVIHLQERIFPGLKNMLSRVIGEDIEFELRIEGDLSPVKIDPGQLEQAILNLVINARDAIQEKRSILKFEGSITISARNCELGVKDAASMPDVRPGPHVQIVVEDNGCGISEENLQKIFTPFFTTKEVGKGTGLGLATVQGIVAQSRGGIQVESKISEGTRFTLYFPKHEGVAPVANLPLEKKEAPNSPKTILLVEDDEQVNRMLKRQLENQGHTVITAKNPKEALTLFKENGEAIHLIVSDMKMPHMSGPEMMELIRAIRQVPSLFISGYPKEHFEKTDEMKDEFLMKPFSPEKLAEKIRTIFKNLDTNKK